MHQHPLLFLSCHPERSEGSEDINYRFSDSSLRSDQLLRTLSEK